MTGLTRRAAFAALLAGTASALFSQRGLLPSFITVVGANALFIAAGQVWVGAIYRLCEVQRPTRRAEHTFAAVCVTAMFALWGLDASPGEVAFAKPRVLITVAPLCATGAIWIRALYNASASPMPLGRRYMLFASTIGLVLNVGRALAFAFGPNGNDPIVSGSVGYALLLANVCVLFTALGTILELERRNQEGLRSENAQLSLDAMTDPLTGLSNRRALERIADGVLRGARRQRWPITVMLLDIDNFKRINDRWGHPVGDAVLREVADVCKARLRGHDVLLRWGGEEFALILPQCTLEAADLVGQRFLSDVRSTALKATKGESVTLSIGIATVEPHEGDFKQAIARADQAMYEAKRAGRDRCVVYGGAEAGELLQAQAE
jgi:diguanylate cyclase (GGDEF)-like protein